MLIPSCHDIIFNFNSGHFSQNFIMFVYEISSFYEIKQNTKHYLISNFIKNVVWENTHLTLF